VEEKMRKSYLLAPGGRIEALTKGVHMMNWQYVGGPFMYQWVGLGSLVFLLVIWELYWRGRALWLAAQSKETGWFVALLVLNTAGILPLLYIYVFSQSKSK